MEYVALDKEYKVTSDIHGEVKLPENTLEVPQLQLVEGPDPLQEVREFVGSDQGIVDAVNDVIRTDAKNGALALIRNGAKDSVLDQLIEKAKNYSKAFKWSTERGSSKRAILEGAEQIRASKDKLADMSQAELLELLQRTILK